LFFGEGTDKNVWYLSSRIYGRRRKEGKGEKDGKKRGEEEELLPLASKIAQSAFVKEHTRVSSYNS
jgi:hypothetical protein